MSRSFAASRNMSTTMPPVFALCWHRGRCGQLRLRRARGRRVRAAVALERALVHERERILPGSGGGDAGADDARHAVGEVRRRATAEHEADARGLRRQDLLVDQQTAERGAAGTTRDGGGDGLPVGRRGAGDACVRGRGAAGAMPVAVLRGRAACCAWEG